MRLTFPSSRKNKISDASGSNPLIYYIRHGETDWNAEMRFQGRQEIPLNDKGRAQAKRNGDALNEVLTTPTDFDFVCSPMLRTRETMEIILNCLNLNTDAYRIDDRLVEMSYGDLEGVTIFDLKANHRDIHLERKADRWHFCPPGGESLAMTLDRVAPVLDEISKPSIIVAHGAVGRGVRKHLLGLSEKDAAWYTFPQDKVFKFAGNNEELL